MAAENFKVKKGLEVGTGITANSDGVNVTGIITATQFKGDGSGLTGVVGSGSGVVIKDEGSAVGTAGTINFVGSGIVAAISEGTATVTVNAGGLDNVVEDTTPQLGGNLDLNSKFVTGSGGINVTGVVTATTLKGNGDFVDIDVDGQTEVDDLNVAGISTFNDDVTFTTTNSKNIVFDKSANDLTFGDSVLARFGDSNDLSIYHDSSSSNIVDTYGALNIKSNILTLRALDNSKYIEALNGSTTKLYFAGDQKLTTTINGIEVPDLNVTGVGTVGRLDTSGVTLGTNATTFAAKFADDAVANFGTDNDLKIYHDDTNGYFLNSKGQTRFENTDGNIGIYASDSNGDIIMRAGGDQSTENAIVAVHHGEVVLSFNGGTRITTTNAGATVAGTLSATTFSGSGASLTNLPSAQLSGALPALDGSALTGITASGSGIIVKHDGSTVGTAGTINFSTNLDVSPISAGIVTVTASGGSGGIAGISTTGTSFFNQLNVSGVTTITSSSIHPLQISSSNSAKIKLSGSNNAAIQFQEGTTDKCFLAWDSGGFFYIKNQETNREIRLANNPEYVRGGTSYKIWNEYNDGSGSTLDADLLDGQEGSYYTNATNLASGTIPNGRFPATLPAASGANLTSLTAGNISGTLSSSQIADEAITFAKMQHVGTGVFIGRNDSGSGDIETLTAAEARTLLNVADGATAGITTAPSNVVLTWDVVNQSTSAYRFTGPGQDPTANNPDIYLVRGNKYRFALNASGHPFQIRVSNGGSAYNDGVTNNGAQTGNVEFYVQNDAPASLVYQCTSHGGMVGNIYITGHQLTNGANNRIVTATSAYGMNGEANLTFDGTQLVVQGGSGTQHMFRHSAGWGGVTSAGSAGGSGAGFSLANNYSGTLETKWSIYLDGSNDGLRFTANSPDQTSDERLRLHSNGKATFITPGGDDALLVKGDTYTSVRIQSARDSASDHAMFQMLGSRGTNASPTIIQNDDKVGTINARAYDGNSYASSSDIIFEVDGTPGDGNMPGRIVFKTSADGSESPTEHLRITSAGQTKLNITSNAALTEPLVIRNGGTGGGTNVGMVFYNGNESNSGAGALAKIKALDVGNYDSDLVFETALKVGWSDGGTTERLRITSTGRLSATCTAGTTSGQFTDATNSTLQIKHPSSGVAQIGAFTGQHLALGANNAEKVRILGQSTPALLIQQTSANADANGWTFQGAIQYSSCCFTSTDVRTMLEFTSYHSTGSKQAKVSIMTDGKIYSRYSTSLQSYSCERRTKKNIVDLDKTKAWNTLRDTPMYSFNYKKEIEGSTKHYGPIVDECPEDIIIPGIEEDEEGIINTVDSDKLQYRAYTALSEALKRIEALEAEVAALKSS